MRWLCLILALTIEAASAADELLLYQHTREGLERQLASLSSQGVRRVTMAILPAGDPKRTPEGEFAMGYGGQGHLDLALPNPAFFQHLDWVLKRFASKGIEVAILPVDARSALFEANSTEKFYEWGRYLGRRYMKAKGLIWLREQGTKGGSAAALEEGIRQFDSVHRWEQWGH